MKKFTLWASVLAVACGMLLPACSSSQGGESQRPTRVEKSSPRPGPVEDVIESMYQACKNGNYEEAMSYFLGAEDHKDLWGAALATVCRAGQDGGSASYEIVSKTERDDGDLTVRIVHTEVNGKQRSNDPVELTFHSVKSKWYVAGFCTTKCK